MGGVIQVLIIADFVEINRRMIMKFGGIFFSGDNNLANPGSLEHVLFEIQDPFFEQNLYPDLIDKAAITSWRIIVGHVFHDGNKRTAMEGCRLFLELNGFKLLIDQEVVRIAIQIANREISYPEYSIWLRARVSSLT
jgi:death-on-curing protein